jgi:hypothetical protein
VFESIKHLRPYFFSLREIESNVSLDIKLPITWKFEQIVAPYKSIKFKVQDKNEKFTLLSIIAQATYNGYETAFTCAKDIIDTNKEMEEKERLLQSKIKELQLLFQHESLDRLKDLTFIENAKTEQESTEGIKLVGEGNTEGPSGDNEPQEEDD